MAKHSGARDAWTLPTHLVKALSPELEEQPGVTAGILMVGSGCSGPRQRQSPAPGRDDCLGGPFILPNGSSILLGSRHNFMPQ